MGACSTKIRKHNIISPSKSNTISDILPIELIDPFVFTFTFNDNLLEKAKKEDIPLDIKQIFIEEYKKKKIINHNYILHQSTKSKYDL